MLSGYAPILFFFGICALFAVFAQVLNGVLGPKRASPTKDLPYESGIVPRESARRRFSVSFYVTAMLFIIFDVESIFLFPWATIVRRAQGLRHRRDGDLHRDIARRLALCLAQGGPAVGLNNELIVPGGSGRGILLADAGAIPLPRTGAAERTAVQSGVVTTTLGKVIQWGRYSSSGLRSSGSRAVPSR